MSGQQNQQSQKVTESAVEINFSLMKVGVRSLQCAALERVTVPYSIISITKAVMLL
jgi:hypothetical protein